MGGRKPCVCEIEMPEPAWGRGPRKPGAFLAACSIIIQDKKDTSLASWFEHGSPVCWISYIVKKKTNLEGSSLCEGHVKTCSAARSEPLPF